MNRHRGLLATAVPLFLLGACARPAPAGGAPEPATGRSPVTESARAGDADAVALRVEYRGGFVPADHLFGRLPVVSVYRDGRVIADGPVPLRYPGPALPNVLVSRITVAQVGELAAEAVAAGVREGADFGTPNVADVPSTRITVDAGYGRQSVDVMALREARPDDEAFTPEQRAARKKLADFVERLRQLPQAGTAGQPADQQRYVPRALAVLARPYTDPQSPMRPGGQAWPGPELPGPALSPGVELGCVTVTGAQKDAVLAAAAKANQITAWKSGDKRWQVSFRPLLPDEKDCAGLRAAAG